MRSFFPTLLIGVAATSLVVSGCASRRGPQTPGTAGGPPTAQSGPPPFEGAQPQPGAGGAPAGALPALDSPEARALAADFQRTAGDRVYFAFDSYSLDAEALRTLDRQAEWLARNPRLRVLVAGHADERGTREYNLALGSRRAEAAREHLSRRGVALERIDTVSYGKERPLDPGSNEAAWSRNRNAHSVLIDLVTAD